MDIYEALSAKLYLRYPAHGRWAKHNGKYAVTGECHNSYGNWVRWLLWTAIQLPSPGVLLPKAWQRANINNLEALAAGLATGPARKRRPNQEAGKNMHNQPTSNRHQPQEQSPESWPTPRVHEDGCRIMFRGDVGPPSTNRTAVASPLGSEICMCKMLCIVRRRSGRHSISPPCTVKTQAFRVAHHILARVGSRSCSEVDVVNESLMTSAF